MATLSLPSRTDILHAAEALAIGAAGGLLFAWASLPGGLISGSMIAVAAAALAGRRLAMPPWAVQIILMTLGVSLGSMVSPELLAGMARYPVSLVLLAAATFIATFGSSLYLQRVHGWDRTSAFLAGTPGALSQITMLATEKGADVAGIAVVQTMRVIALTASLPILLAVLGVSAPPGAAAHPLTASPTALAVLAVTAVLVSYALHRLNFPASWMFGAMLGSSILHGTGLVIGGLPDGVYAMALIGIGALIGTRFAKISVATLLRHMKAAIGSFVVAIAVSSVFVAFIVLGLGAKFSDTVVAFAPGAMDSMLALALTLHIDPLFVGAHHLARFMFVSITTPGIVHLFGKPQVDADD
ncbi:MAG: AbrB family transcriptional regulator [Pseudomonadota bacterium]